MYDAVMKIFRHASRVSAALVISLAPVPLPLLDSASAQDLGSTDFNIALNLAGLAQRSVTIGSLNCSDGSRSFGSTTEMMIGLAMDQRVQTQLSLNCRPTLAINSGVQTLSGTMTIPSRGVTDGVFTADCSARGSMAVVASVAVGAAVSGLISVNVASASAPLAFGCTFKGSSASKATDVFGTIEGYADVTGMCNSACVAVGMTAKATVTAATGELKGQTGTGTYTYTDAFELPELATVADQLASMKGKKRERDSRVSCPEGTSDCTAYSTNPCPNGEDSCKFETTGCPPGATCTTIPTTIPACPPGATCVIEPKPNTSDQISTALPANSRPPSTMRVALRSGAGDAVIVRPMPSTDGGTASITASEPVMVSGPPGAKCTFSLTGKKAAKRSVSLSATGTASVAYSNSQIAALPKQLGLPAKSKTKPTITATLACSTSDGPIAVKTRRFQLG